MAFLKTAGEVYLRDEADRNAPHRNTFRANLIESNGLATEPSYRIRVEGETANVVLEGNTIRDTRSAGAKHERVAIYLGAKVSHIDSIARSSKNPANAHGSSNSPAAR
jgi:hypothetical protein